MKLFFILIVLTSSCFANADYETRLRFIGENTVQLPIKTTLETIQCTDRGYGNMTLKISVPALDYLAHFDHRVLGEGQPCIAHRRCEDADKLLIGESDFTVPAKIGMQEYYSINHIEKKCTSMLRETIGTTIKGLEFFHVVYGAEQERNYETCLKVISSSESVSQ